MSLTGKLTAWLENGDKSAIAEDIASIEHFSWMLVTNRFHDCVSTRTRDLSDIGDSKSIFNLVVFEVFRINWMCSHSERLLGYEKHS